MVEEPAFRISQSNAGSRQVALRELAPFFLRLGTTAFGGPAAHIGIMEDDLVRRRRWLSREAFLDLLGATNLIPGPSSSELAIHIGYLCAGWRGLVIAGSCFVLPAALMVGGLGWLYVHFGNNNASIFSPSPFPWGTATPETAALRSDGKTGWSDSLDFS